MNNTIGSKNSNSDSVQKYQLTEAASEEGRIPNLSRKHFEK
jgi:hypothetical protein